MEIEKVKKLLANSHVKTDYTVHIRYLKQALNHEQVLKKVHTEIKSNQNAWLKPYIGMNTDLRKKAKMILKNVFFKLLNNAVFRKNMEKWENLEIDLSQHKEQETIWCRTKLSYHKFLHRKFFSNKTEKKKRYFGINLFV